MDKWLLCSMADNDTFEWIDVLTCDVLAGDGSVFSARNRPMLPDPLHRGVCPFECAVRSVGRCDWAVGVRVSCVLVRGCSLCRVRERGARASCSVEAREPGVHATSVHSALYYCKLYS